MNTFTGVISWLLALINETGCVVCKVQDESKEGFELKYKKTGDVWTT